MQDFTIFHPKSGWFDAKKGQRAMISRVSARQLVRVQPKDEHRTLPMDEWRDQSLLRDACGSCASKCTWNHGQVLRQNLNSTDSTSFYQIPASQKATSNAFKCNAKMIQKQFVTILVGFRQNSYKVYLFRV
jgi:hypothetical protein